MADWSNVVSTSFKWSWSNVASGEFSTLLAFEIISVGGDDTILPDEIVEVVCRGAGTTEGLVYWGGVEQTVVSWTDTLITVGPVNASGKAPGQQYAWDVLKPV